MGELHPADGIERHRFDGGGTGLDLEQFDGLGDVPEPEAAQVDDRHADGPCGRRCDRHGRAQGLAPERLSGNSRRQDTVAPNRSSPRGTAGPWCRPRPRGRRRTDRRAPLPWRETFRAHSQSGVPATGVRPVRMGTTPRAAAPRNLKRPATRAPSPERQEPGSACWPEGTYGPTPSTSRARRTKCRARSALPPGRAPGPP